MMKIRTGIIILVVIAVASFLAGKGITLLGGKQAQERKVLYYVDPMNPAFRSEKPGIAPCGMPPARHPRVPSVFPPRSSS
jgi:hypothetical protein